MTFGGHGLPAPSGTGSRTGPSANSRAGPRARRSNPGMDRLVTELLFLASLWTGIPAPASVPDVERPLPAEMPCRCLGFYAYGATLVAYGAVAPAPDRLLVRSDVDLASPMGRSILFHELVHALQATRGPAATGSAEWQRRERQAYRLQHRFLEAQEPDGPGAWRTSANAP